MASLDGLSGVYLVRHGETEWSLAGRHTGRTDVPLTLIGEAQATGLREYLSGIEFSWVASSPLKRAVDTCKLAGFNAPEPVDDLMEWDYGNYEGMTLSQIHQSRPDWDLWIDGVPGGEGVADVGKRADRVLQLIRGKQGNVLLFSHGHFLRVLAARWLALDVSGGRLFALQPAAVSVLGFEHGNPVISIWDMAIDSLSGHG